MAEDIPFDRTFDAPPKTVVRVSPLIRRVVAGNASPFTFTGTCSYIVGRGTVAIIDPGPEDEAQTAALIAAVAGETVSHIVITHTHRDHSPGAVALKAATGALLVGCGPHVAARDARGAEAARLDASADTAYAPDAILADGDTLVFGGLSLQAVATPGHTMNHLAFAFAAENALFSGDHVMGWSTTIVAPPDGAMGPYMASLDKLRARNDAVYWPGHGGPVSEPQRFVRAIASHRRARENAILQRLKAGDRLISEIVPKLYDGLDPRLHGAAALSVFAHLEDMVERGIAASDGPARLDSTYEAA
jgi:glyoxylase-like metal-dependent hydrolase (beta-lactamase superfamily II)